MASKATKELNLTFLNLIELFIKENGGKVDVSQSKCNISVVLTSNAGLYKDGEANRLANVRVAIQEGTKPIMNYYFLWQFGQSMNIAKAALLMEDVIFNLYHDLIEIPNTDDDIHLPLSAVANTCITALIFSGFMVWDDIKPYVPQPFQDAPLNDFHELQQINDSQ